MALEFFLGSFVILLIIGTPIYISMIASSVLYILLSDNVSFIVMIQRMASSVNSFPLLAVPLFIFAGQLMNASGVTKRIFNFALKLVGHFHGGLGYVNIFSSIKYSGMSC